MAKDERERITISLKPDVLELLTENAAEIEKPRSHFAGDIIEDFFKKSDERTKDSEIIQYETAIARLESEVSELKRQRTWFEGELSKLHDGMIAKLPAPAPERKRFVWPWNKI